MTRPRPSFRARLGRIVPLGTAGRFEGRQFELRGDPHRAFLVEERFDGGREFTLIRSGDFCGIHERALGEPAPAIELQSQRG